MKYLLFMPGIKHNIATAMNAYIVEWNMADELISTNDKHVVKMGVLDCWILVSNMMPRRSRTTPNDCRGFEK